MQNQKTVNSHSKTKQLLHTGFPANTTHPPNVGSMLARRLRRRSNIDPTLGRCVLFAGNLHDRTTIAHILWYVVVQGQDLCICRSCINSGSDLPSNIWRHFGQNLRARSSPGIRIGLYWPAIPGRPSGICSWHCRRRQIIPFSSDFRQSQPTESKYAAAAVVLICPAPCTCRAWFLHSLDIANHSRGAWWG